MKQFITIILTAAIFIGLLSSCSVVEKQPVTPPLPPKDVYILTSLERLEQTVNPLLQV